MSTAVFLILAPDGKRIAVIMPAELEQRLRRLALAMPELTKLSPMIISFRFLIHDRN